MRRLIALALLLLAGCRIDGTVEVDLASDGTANGLITVITDSEFEQSFALTGRDFEQLLDSRARQIPGLDFTRAVEGDRITYSGTFQATDPMALEDAMARLGIGLAPFRVMKDDRSFVVSSRTTPLPDTTELASIFGGLDPHEFTDQVDVRLRLHMPGSVVEHSAPAVSDDGTLEWRLPFSDEAVSLVARSRVGAAFPWWPLVLLVAAAIGVLWVTAIRSTTGLGPTGPPLMPQREESDLGGSIEPG